MAGRIERDHWHPGFLSAMELEFLQYKGNLDFNGEFQLSREPLRMDLLIIKKQKEIVIDNQIGSIFRTHNIIEFKSPRDGLTIDDYIKTVGYAYIYKGLGNSVNAIPLSELTVTLVRDVVPVGLFERIKEEGGSVEERYPGIFYINGVVNIPTQFILTSSLDKNMHICLRILSEHAEEEDIKRFIKMASELSEPIDRQNVDALLQVSISANSKTYDNIKRGNPFMCEALRELMKDEIQEEKQKAIDTSLIAVIKNLMKNSGCDATTAMEKLGIPATDQIRYAAKL